MPKTAHGNQWRIARIFVSSSFRDMVAERDALVRRVFPQLNEEFRAEQILVREVDLRWGVPSDVTLPDIVGACIAEVGRCRPFFLGIVGQHYGSVDASGRSLTELEFESGPLGHDAASFRCTFLLRQTSTFADTNAVDHERVARFRARIAATSVKHGWPLHEYELSAGSRHPTLQFESLVATELRAAIRSEFGPPPVPPADSHDFENVRHALLEKELLLHAVPRDYATELTRDRLGGKHVVVTGALGAGKSTLLAQLGHELRAQGMHVVLHFAKASESATSLEASVERLARNLALQLDPKLNGASGLLKALMDFRPTAPTALIVDDIDLILPELGTNLAPWLPGVTDERFLIVSSARAAPRWFAGAEFQLGPLSPNEQRLLLASYPSIYAKRLSAHQHAMLAGNDATMNPLFLVVSVDLLRALGAFDTLDAQIAALPTVASEASFAELFARMVDCLCEELDSAFVRWTIEALLASRAGLTRSELLNWWFRYGGSPPQDPDLQLGETRAVISILMVETAEDERAADDMLQILTLRLNAFLAHGATSPDGQTIDIANPALKAELRRRMLDAEAERRVHRQLASCFARAIQNRWRRDRNLPFHLAEGGLWGLLAAQVVDRSFLESVGSKPGRHFGHLQHLWGMLESKGYDMSSRLEPLLEHDAKALDSGVLLFVQALLASRGRLDACARVGAIIDHRLGLQKEKRMPTTRIEALRERERIMMEYEQSLLAGGQKSDSQDIARGQLLQLRKRLSDVSEGECVEVDVLNALGVVSRHAGDLDRALAYFSECEQLAKRLDDDDQVAQALANRANILRDQGNLDDAAEALSSACDCLKRDFDPELHAAFLCNLANLQIQRGRLAEAIEAAGEAELLSRENGEIKILRFARFNLAQAHGMRADLDLAAELFAKCLDTARDVHGAVPPEEQVVGSIVRLASSHDDRSAADSFLRGITERLTAGGHHDLAESIVDAVSQASVRTMQEVASMAATQDEVPEWKPVSDGSLARRLAFGHIEAQYRDAIDKLHNRSYWRNVGQDVMDATLLARSALETVADTAHEKYVALAIERIETARDDYRESHEDEDGFGSATFGEILRELESLRGSAAVPSKVPRQSKGGVWAATMALLTLLALAAWKLFS